MSSALRTRRLTVVYAPLFAAVLIVAGFFLDPAIGDSGRELAREYAAAPGREQVSAVALHFAFAALALPAVALIVSVRGRGAWLANVAGLLAFLGLTTLPGFLLTDFYDIAIYGELGGNAWQAVNDRLEELPGAAVVFLTGFVGFIFALPAALLAAWRGGLLPWWPALAVLLGAISARILPGGFGLLVWAGTLAALTYALRDRARDYLVP
ncbi:MAG TPA: hypothetical protein VGQ15_06075 [Gaiellaceae bacterium]|nr:hypothetical protein [Gaiellaceae bacterium]